MRRMKSIPGCWLLLMSLCFAGSAGQRHLPYPQNAGDIISFAEIFSRAHFSVSDAIKRFGTVNSAERDDFRVVLKPFSSEQHKIEKIVLGLFDDTAEGRRKPDYVEINYIKPISISYGELREKYGMPALLPMPRVKCPRGVNCHPAFVGYSFRFVPDAGSLASGKSLEVNIDLEMEWSKQVPRHTDKDFLAVKAIRFKRIWKN